MGQQQKRTEVGGSYHGHHVIISSCQTAGQLLVLSIPVLGERPYRYTIQYDKAEFENATRSNIHRAGCCTSLARCWRPVGRYLQWRYGKQGVCVSLSQSIFGSDTRLRELLDGQRNRTNKKRLLTLRLSSRPLVLVTPFL